MDPVMASPIEFYFDFSSPYGYLAAQRIDEVADAHDRAVKWKPFLLGALFKTTGAQPLLGIPMKGDYARRDIARSARLFDIPFKLPKRFPFMSVAACRAFYWLCERDADESKVLAQALYAQAFAKRRSIAYAAELAAVAA